jgi:hypothetical protein
LIVTLIGLRTLRRLGVSVLTFPERLN